MSQKPRRKGVSSLFTLKGINVKKLIQKYYYPELCSDKNTPIDEKSTPISFDNEETADSKEGSLNFLSPYKENIKYWPTMIGVGDDEPLPRFTSKSCWWCQENFTTAPIGCPLKYHAEKNEIEFPIEKRRFREHLKTFNFPFDAGNDWFETDGIFCSFPCTKSYIFQKLTETKTSKYSQSLTLLTVLAYRIYKKLLTIPTAAPRRQLARWNGPLSAEQHRNSFGFWQYVETGNLRRPLLYSCREYIREKRIKPSIKVI